MASKSARIESALPFVLPVLGGLLGVTFVQLNSWLFINPVLAIAIGAIAGRVVAYFLVKAMRKARRRSGAK